MLGVMGVVYLWTAMEMIGAFVAVGVFVITVEMTGAGGALAAFRMESQRSGLTRRVLGVAAACAVFGVVTQNLLH